MRRTAVLAGLLLMLLLAQSSSSAAPPACGHGQRPPCQPGPASAMGRLVTSGFELKSQSNQLTCPDGGASVVPATFETTIVRSGSVSAKHSGNTASMTNWQFAAPALGSDLFGRIYIYVPTGGLPSTQVMVMLSGGGGVQLNSDATLTLQAFVGGSYAQQGSASAPITLDAWNRVEFRVRIGTGSVDEVEGRLEGASFASASGLNISDTVPPSFQAGASTQAGDNGLPAGAGFVLYADDVAVNDSGGASQNSWPGSGKVVLLKPISDNAGGAGWTLGTGTALGGNGFAAVDNIPPVGVADLAAGSDPKQIRNASSNANSNYDANMTSYSTAGLVAGDTVNVVVPFVSTAAPVTTSAKLGTVGVVSNPAITNVNLGAGGTSGAFWSGTTAGTYPTGWKWSSGTTTYAPSVTVGTSPVMRITQVTSSTRIAMVSFMGMYVDYTSAVSTSDSSAWMNDRHTARRRTLQRI